MNYKQKSISAWKESGDSVIVSYEGKDTEFWVMEPEHPDASDQSLQVTVISDTGFGVVGRIHANPNNQDEILAQLDKLPEADYEEAFKKATLSQHKTS